MLFPRSTACQGERYATSWSPNRDFVPLRAPFATQTPVESQRSVRHLSAQEHRLAQRPA